MSADTSGTERFFDDIEKQIKFALSKTINRLAYESARKKMPEKAESTFEGGATAYTKRAFKYTRSTKQNLTAYVFLDTVSHDYLVYQIEGGTRSPKRKKILVPTRNTRLNKYGNLTRSKRQQFFANSAKYFQGTPKGKTGTAFEGVWERYGRNKAIRMVAKYADRANYHKKLPFRKTIDQFVALKAAEYFEIEFRDAMRTSR